MDNIQMQISVHSVSDAAAVAAFAAMLDDDIAPQELQPILYMCLQIYAQLTSNIDDHNDRTYSRILGYPVPEYTEDAKQCAEYLRAAAACFDRYANWFDGD